MNRFVVFVLLACATAKAQGQAFGVAMGDPASKYSAVSTGTRFQFKIKVPQPNSEFEFYLAIATPETGICKVSGIGKDRENKYGTEVKSAYDQLTAALTGRYGNAKSFDFLRPGAIWDGPDEFVWSIYKDERVLSAFWTRGDGASLPSNISAIGLSVEAVNASAAYISLGYEFANFDRCGAIRKSSDNTGL